MISIAIGVVTLIGLVALWPSLDVRAKAGIGPSPRVYHADVTKVTTFRCNDGPTGSSSACVRYHFRLTQGPYKGEARTIEFPDAPSTPRLSVGDEVILAKIRGADVGFDYVYSDHQRRSALLLLAGCGGSGSHAGGDRERAAKPATPAPRIAIFAPLACGNLGGPA